MLFTKQWWWIVYIFIVRRQYNIAGNWNGNCHCHSLSILCRDNILIHPLYRSDSIWLTMLIKMIRTMKIHTSIENIHGGYEWKVYLNPLWTLFAHTFGFLIKSRFDLTLSSSSCECPFLSLSLNTTASHQVISQKAITVKHISFSANSFLSVHLFKVIA